MPESGLGARLARARDARHLTQEEVADVLGVSRVLISHWERDERRPNEIVLERLATIYGTSLGALVGIESSPEPAGNDLAELLYRDAAGGVDLRARVGLRDFVAFLDRYANFADALGERLRPLMASPFVLEDGFATKADIQRKALEVRNWLNLGHGPVGDLPGLLDDAGVTIVRTALGRDLESAVSGAFLMHQRLGMCIAVNVETTPGRQLFTLAHELAHALYHSADRLHMVSVSGQRNPRERFADQWASEFLMPIESLRRTAEALGSRTIDEAEPVIHLQRHFGGSYGLTLLRLRHAGMLSDESHERLRRVKPVALAHRLGYAVDREEWGKDPDRWRLERFPRRFVRLLTRALRDERISPASAAGLTSLTIDEIAELMSPPIEDDAASDREFEEYEGVRARL